MVFISSFCYAEDWVRNPDTGNRDVVYDKASEIDITDSGGYYTGTEVETALQEIASGTTQFQHLIPQADDTYDIGENSTPLEWKDLYLDGTAYLDAMEISDGSDTTTFNWSSGVFTTSATDRLVFETTSDRIDFSAWTNFRLQAAKGGATSGEFEFQQNTSTAMGLKLHNANNQLLWYVKDDFGNQLILTNQNNESSDHDFDTAINPTFVIYSDLDPDISNNQKGWVAHDQENFNITTGAATGAGSAPTTDENDIVFLPRGAEQFRVKGDGGASSPGTIEGAILTEGGNAVYNSTETPGGELGGTWASPTVDSSIHDDEYVELGDNFVGDVTGPYDATVVGDDSHAHIYSNIDAFTEANLYSILSDVTQFYEAGDDISADESDPNVDTHAEIIAIIDNTATDVGTGVWTFAGLTLGANENITLGAQTLDHDGTDFNFNDNITFGAGTTGDIALTFNEDTTDGTITWDSSENEFDINDQITISGTANAQNLFPGGAVFNDGSYDQNFRVETNANQYGLFVDAGLGQTAINDASPVATLDVGGGSAGTVDGTDDLIVADDVEIDGSLYVDTPIGYCSITVTATGNAGTSRDIFDEDNYTTFTSTNNVAASEITYTSTDGRFTVTNAGVYLIYAEVLMIASASDEYQFDIQVNGASTYSGHDIFTHTAVDVKSSSMMLIKSLSANDYINVIYKSQDGVDTVTPQDGSTMTMYKLK